MYRSRFFLIFLFLCSLALFLYPDIGTDSGWHLRVGEYIVTQHKIPYTDFLSFSMEGYPYVYHSWFTEVLLFLAYTVAGLWGVSFLYSLLFTFALYFVTKTTRLSFKKAFIISLAFAPVIVGIVGIRTQVATYLLATLLLLILERASSLEYQGRSFFRWLTITKFWAIPIIFVIWSNVHGGFVLGLVLLSIFLFATVFSEYLTRRDLKAGFSRLPFYFTLIFICIIVTGLNPYGFRQLQQAFAMQTNTTALSQNLDWHPLFQVQTTTFAHYSIDILVVVLGIASFIGARLRKKSLKDQLMLGVILVLCFVTTRFALLLLIVALPILVEGTAKMLQRLRDNGFLYWLTLGFTVTIISASALFRIDQALCANKSESCYAWLSRLSAISAHYPYDAMAYMRTHGVPSRLLNNYNHGGYLHFHFPGHQFYIDGRMDNFFNEGNSFVEEYLQLIHAKTGWEEIFTQYDFNAYLGKQSWLLSAELVNRGWVPVVKDDVNVLLLPPHP